MSFNSVSYVGKFFKEMNSKGLAASKFKKERIKK